jgi:hypothetical protein
MELVTRRAFIGAGASTALATLGLPGHASATKVRFKIGVTDWNLKLEGKIESISLARQLGFDGVQISIGKGKDRLPLSDPALQKAFLKSRAGGFEDRIAMPRNPASELLKIRPIGTALGR